MNVFGYISIYERNGDDFNSVYSDNLGIQKEIAYIRVIEAGENGITFTLSDADKEIFLCSYENGELKKNGIRRKGKAGKIKWYDIIKWNSFVFTCIYNEDGVIELWDQKMKEQIFLYNTKRKITSVDIKQKDDYLNIAVFTKASQLIVSELSLKRLFEDMKGKDSYNVIKEKLLVDIMIDQGSSNQKESKFISHNICWLDSES